MADTPPVANTNLPDTAARSIGRIFFGSVAGAALASAVMLSVLPPGLPVGERVLLVSSLVALAILCGLAMRANRSARFPINAALCATALGAMALTGLVSLILRAGLHSPALGFLGLIVCATGAITGRRISLVLGGVAALLVGALAWGEVSGMMLRPALASPLSLALLYHWLIILCATVAAMLIAQVLGNSLAAAKKRDQRFRTLLRVAADWYWELDRDLRFAYTSKSPPGISGINHLDRLNRTPWELADTDLSDEEMAAHRADLEAHRPFNGLLTRRRNAQGVWCTISSSGEPRFDAGGMFTGYWGVSRDVSNEVRSQDAITASETRYRELFTRSPSPLFLHRRGIVFDANDAAARMFGFANAAAMNGFDIMGLFPAGASVPGSAAICRSSRRWNEKLPLATRTAKSCAPRSTHRSVRSITQPCCI